VYGLRLRVEGSGFDVDGVYSVWFIVHDLRVRVKSSITSKPKRSKQFVLVGGLGLGVWGLGFGVWGLGFGVWGLYGVWFMVCGLRV